jgi:hypothetical protein
MTQVASYINWQHLTSFKKVHDTWKYIPFNLAAAQVFESKFNCEAKLLTELENMRLCYHRPDGKNEGQRLPHAPPFILSPRQTSTTKHNIVLFTHYALNPQAYAVSLPLPLHRFHGHKNDHNIDDTNQFKALWCPLHPAAAQRIVDAYDIPWHKMRITWQNYLTNRTKI